MIQIYSNSLGVEELNAIQDVFNSKWIGKGPKEHEFVKAMSTRIITENMDGLACTTLPVENITTSTCCTEAIFQILDLIDLKQDDEVVMPSISFVGVANAVMYKKAKVVFCDVDRSTLNPTLENIKSVVTNKTKAVILIHYAGVPCNDIIAIADYCKQNNIILIEDNANSPFSTFIGKSTGTFGDFGVWSFDAMKILVMGDGALITAKNPEHIKLLNKQMYLGLETPSGLSNTVDSKWWQFDVSVPGRRSVINDITAAIGIEQLKKVNDFITRRKEIHDRYIKELANVTWLQLPSLNNSTSSYYMFHVQLTKRDEFASFLREKGIYTTFRYYPLHWVKFYNCNYTLPNTEFAANHTLCLPIHQNLTDDDVTYIIKTIKEFI